MPSKPSRFNKGFTLVELLVVIAIIGILVGMILPAVQAAREQARRTSCLNKVRNVALACVSYESANQQFPAAVSSGEESFLVRILPMIEQGGLYDSFRASTGTDPRISLSMNLIDTFICDSTTQVQSEANSFGGTFTSHYASSAGPVSLGTSGPYTVDNGFAREINGNDNGLIGLRGLFSPTNSSNVFAAATKSGVRTSDVTDGMSNTLAITETSRSPSNSGDRSFGIRRPRWTHGEERAGGDDRLNWSRAIARQINTFDVGEGSNQTAQPHHELCISSNHPGGANVANGDGSTHFVSEDTDLVVLQAVAGVDEGDVANQNLDF